MTNEAFPVLKKLSISRVLRNVGDFLNITHLSIIGSRSFSLESMRACLSGRPSLTSLELNLPSFVQNSSLQPGDDSGLILLEGVVTLRVLGVVISRPDHTAFLSSLRTPKLERFHMSMVETSSNPYWVLFQDKVQALNNINTLHIMSATSFTFFLDFSSQTAVPIPLMHLLRRMPALETLTIKYGRYTSPWAQELDDPGEMVPFSNLRNLKLVCRYHDKDNVIARAILGALHPLVNPSDVDVIIEAEDESLLAVARIFFPQARREWFTDKSILDL